MVFPNSQQTKSVDHRDDVCLLPNTFSYHSEHTKTTVGEWINICDYLSSWKETCYSQKAFLAYFVHIFVSDFRTLSVLNHNSSLSFSSPTALIMHTKENVIYA